MPEVLKMMLKKKAKKKGLKGKSKNAYVFGALQNISDWKPGKKIPKIGEM